MQSVANVKKDYSVLSLQSADFAKVFFFRKKSRSLFPKITFPRIPICPPYLIASCEPIESIIERQQNQKIGF